MYNFIDQDAVAQSASMNTKRIKEYGTKVKHAGHIYSRFAPIFLKLNVFDG